MKNRYFRSLPQAFVVCVAPLLACASAFGSVVATNESNSTGVWTLPSGTNLLTGSVPSTSPSTHEGSSGTWATVTDGTLGDTGGTPATSCTPSNNESVIFPLDLSGAHSAGYNITSFDSYCAWGDSGRDNQDYTLQYATVAAPSTYITIGAANNHTAVDRATHVRLTNNTGFLATGVSSIRIIFAGNQENGYTGYREFVLQDTPVVTCVSTERNNNNAFFLPGGTNLLAGRTPLEAGPDVHEGSSASWATLTDGSLGDYTTNGSSCTPSNGTTVTFPLDLTAKPAGYDITSFDSYCAWGSSGRDDQNYTFAYSTVADPGTFITLTEVANHTEWTGSYDSGYRATHSRVTANGGKLALGVAAIRLTFHDQENGYVGYRELVLRDTPLLNTIGESNTTNAWTLPSGTNLLNGATANTPSAPAGSNHGNGDITSSSWMTLTDGSVGSAGSQSQSVAPLEDTSVIFPFDITTNTKGYNLTSFDSYAAWGDTGRDNQDFTILYSTVTNPFVFIPIDTIANHTNSPLNATHSRITAASGFIANNVGALKFYFKNQENGYVGYREFIALGNAVPLASPLIWSGLSGAGGNANWATTADNNWTDGVSSSSFTSLAPLTFDSTGVNTTISIPVALTAASLTFSNDNTRSYAFSGQLLTVSNSVTKSGSGNVAFGNSVQATGLSVGGTGSVTLSVDNALSGSATVSNGTLNLASNGALGTAALSLTGGTVNFTSAAPVVTSLSGTSGTVNLGNPSGSGHTNLSVGDTTTAAYAGSIADATVSATGSLVKTGTGSLSLTGTNSYTGTTTVSNGELQLGQRLSLYNGNTASWTASNIIVNTALSLRMGGTGEFTSSDVAALNTGGFTPGAILSLDTTSGDVAVSDSISGAIKLEKDGPNTLTLSGTNGFTQGITITQGTFVAANPAGISIPSDLTVGNATFDIFANLVYDNQFGANALLKFQTGPGAPQAKLQLRGTNQTVAGLESTTSDRLVILQNDETLAPGYTTNPGVCSLTIDTATGSFHSFHGIIRNMDGASMSLIKNGLGTQELINSTIQGDSYDGPTTVNAGTLKFNFAGGNTGFGSNITVAAPATLQFHAVGGDYNFAREISGAGHVVVDGVNAVRITSNNNSWSGGTTVGDAGIIYQGFLALEGTGAAGEGTALGQNCVAGAMIPTNVITVENGATLALDGIASLGNSGMLPQFAPSVRINEKSTLSGGSSITTFVPNITLDGSTINITSGGNAGGFSTDLAFVGTLVVGGDSILPSTIQTTGTGPYANASLGSLGLLGTTFQVADVTSSSDPDLIVTSILQDVGGHASPLTKTGAGTMQLLGANTYTGDTTVLEGTLAVSGNSIADTNKLIINGGKVDVAAATNEIVGSLYFGSAQQIAGTYGSTSSSATHQDDSRFSGSGIVTVTTGPVADPYAVWSAQISDPSQRGRAADPDGDGFTNLQEYLFGTSPTTATGSLTQLEVTPSGLIVHWNQLATGTSVYVLRESATMMESPWPVSTATITDSAVQDLPGYVRKQALIPIDSARKFIRVDANE